MIARTAPRSALLAALVIVVAAVPVAAQQQQAPPEDQRARLGVGSIEVIESLQRQLEREGKASMVARVAETLEPQLIDRLHNTRRFVMVARGDLDEVLQEQELGPMLEEDTAPEELRISGLDYLVVVAIEHFEDRTERRRFEGRQLEAVRRTVELGATAKLWDTETGELLESASWEIASDDDDLDLPAELRTSMRRAGIEGEDDALNRLLRRMSQAMAQRVANRVIDVIYPARIAAVQSDAVIINRGDGTDISRGERWAVYHRGEEMFDPDLGFSLGYEETRVGEVRITEVRPMFSRAEVVEDLGIESGHILRRLDVDADESP